MHHYQPTSINIAAKESKSPFGLPIQENIDEQTVNYVYNRYIDMLQYDKNATIDQILKEEPIASSLRDHTRGLTYNEREIEQAVIEKLYQEEET